MNKVRLIFLVCIALFTYQGTFGQEVERWYTVSMGGSPVGYLLEKNEANGEQHTSLIEMNISIGRLGSTVKMETRTFQTEKEGLLIGINSEMYISNEKKVESVQVMDDHLLIESQGFNKRLPMDSKLTGPKQLEELLRKQIENGRKTVHYTTYSAELGMFMNGSLNFTGTEKVSIKGMEFNAIMVEESIQELPYVRKKWLSKEGMLLKSSEPGPFGDMEVVWTNKENALRALNNSVDLPEDQYGSSMAYANYRLSNPRDLSSIKLKITQKRPEFGFPDFSGDYQDILSKSDKEIILQINKPEITLQNNEPSELEEYLEPNAFLDNSDELLIEKTKEVIGDETDDWEKAKLIADWVRKNMSFDAGIALADSREVIRDLKGTCVSYGILTSTMSKAAGIPSRFLMGYVYVDGAWGGHAWSEVNINGHWIPIDAAVPNDTYIADAARFFMVRSSLKDGMGKANIAGMQLVGNIDVNIIEHEVDGELHTATENPYFIENDIYTNPGLKFAMKKLEGFEFTDVDLFYPENTILKQTKGASEITVGHWTYGSAEEAMASTNRILGQAENSNTLRPVHSGSYEGFSKSSTNETLAVIRDDTKSFFILTSTGPEHSELLAKATEAIK
ncbi:transglutaminase family protein [Rhodonellum sp.]|uniref:transglutaminase-like domain-containing protein n=1 Tax=Rhodonellum sp. TaxID=2231180 RepID=UPI0027204FAE|nr:transglutaminase-like domain-containing protein [Rhodonellum sp.]MDO9552225.1 transglutaminase-like domain-containing protein [Rhodonellum sp.]